MPSELDTFLSRSTRTFSEAFEKLASAIVRGVGVERALEEVAEVIGQTMALADLMGRRRVLLEVDRSGKPEEFSASPIIPNVPFDEAIADIIRREPRLALNAEAVARLYREQHAFALANSSSEYITARVQKVMANLIEKGATGGVATAAIRAAAIESTKDFTKAYADTVYRTNTATAYTAGRIQQAFDPEVDSVLKAFEVIGSNDADTRRGRKKDHGENHKAALGLIADKRDSIWQTHTPPYGYRCRHSLRNVFLPELKRKGLWENGRVLRYTPAGFENFAPHENFKGGSPAMTLYGGGSLT